MDKPRIRPWIESDLNKTETFKVSQSTRIRLPGKIAEVFGKGATIELSGQQKKDLYFRNVVFYPEDFEKVKAYEKEQRELFRQAPVMAQPAPGANKEIDALKKQNVELQKRFDELKATVDTLTGLPYVPDEKDSKKK